MSPLYKLLEELRRLLTLLSKAIVNIADEPEEIEPEGPTKADEVYEAAFAEIGNDLSKLAPDELGCSEAVSKVLKKVYPSFPILISTIRLHDYMRTSTHFVSSANPIAGSVAIFPTEGKKIGHVGIWGRRGWVMSNNSGGTDKGKWTANYTTFGFKEEAAKRGLKIYYFIPQ